jgi:hypothetical protein
MLNETRDKLANAEERVRGLREEKARARTVQAAAKAAAEESGTEASLNAARAATDAVSGIDIAIDEASAQQMLLLQRVADAESGMSGFSTPTMNGWEEASRRLSLSGGNLRVDVPAGSLLSPRRLTPVPASPDSPGNRYLWPVLESQPFGSGDGDLVATDYTVSFSNAELTGTTGNVEIETATDAQKATLSPTIALATPSAKTFAVVGKNVPSQLFDSQLALQAFLSSELGRRLADKIDAHVVTAIQAATPPNSTSGSDLVAKIRNSISSMRTLGGDPTVIAMTPADAGALDLTEDTAGNHVFRVDLEGSGNPVWSLQVRESPTVTAPTLVDPSRIGLTYLGGASVLADPFSSMETNLVKVRAEVEAKFHVRNVQQGAYRIA